MPVGYRPGGGFRGPYRQSGVDSPEEPRLLSAADGCRPTPEAGLRHMA
ncbi:hypothetical protein [Streptomyces sp. NBC_01190]|nr:hypothetical protein OG519_19655 [Streptomyces sp. NBC_01190]